LGTAAAATTSSNKAARHLRETVDDIGKSFFLTFWANISQL